MPITSPSMLTRGPPELPGLMAASVWMKDWNWRFGTMLRPLAETMPAVTGARDPKGLPNPRTPAATCNLFVVSILCTPTGCFPVIFVHRQLVSFVGAFDVAIVVYPGAL